MLAWPHTCRLWLVLDRAAAYPRTLPDVARLAIAGGVDAVVCRLKDVPPAERRGLALPVRDVCRELGVRFIMSHVVELALELQADALHVGAGGPPWRELRRRLGHTMALGYSAHSVDEAANQFAHGTDYVFLGPVFPTPAKLQYGPPLGLGVVEPAQALSGPVVFIGGINSTTLPRLIAAGAQRCAAIAALQSVADVTAAAVQMKQLLQRSSTNCAGA